MLSQLQKQSLTTALKGWLDPANPERSQRALAPRANVSTASISLIADGKYINGASPISDKIFLKIADAIGHSLELGKLVIHWNSYRFEKMQKAIGKAQRKAICVPLDMPTGTGKTYAAEFYAANHDKALYIKCEASMRRKDLLREICEKLRIDPKMSGSRAMMLAIRDKVIEGGWVLLIDEIEVVTHEVRLALKEIYDFTLDRCGLVILGALFLAQIDTLADRGRMGMPQLRSRLTTPNTLVMGEVSKAELTGLCTEKGIHDPQLLQFLVNRCPDIRSLKQYVLALLEAAEHNQCDPDWELAKKLFGIA